MHVEPQLPLKFYLSSRPVRNDTLIGKSRGHHFPLSFLSLARASITHHFHLLRQ